MSAKMHLSLNVNAIGPSIAFYEAFLGAPPHKVRPGYANFEVADPPLKLALEERPVEEPAALTRAGALNHLGVMVASREDVAAAKQRLIDAGLATFDEKDTTCCFAVQDKIWVTDPDGNRWEVYALIDDLAEEHATPATRARSGIGLAMHSGDCCR